MKKLLLILTLLTFNFSLSTLLAQAPQAIPYQAVARDNAGNAIASQAVSLRFTIHDATSGGTIVYRETQIKTTNSLGLFTANIGEGTVVSGTFASVSWGSGSKFMQVEMDTTGGTSYTDMGTQQMLSVPYALHAMNGLMQGSANGEMLYWNGSSWVAVAPGTDNQTLTFCSGIPTWGPCPVSICSQTWMLKNLNVDRYRNGDPIPKVTDPTIWAGLTTGAYCYYNNDSTTYAAIYGKLYNWYAVNDPRGFAPLGWHVPSDGEWAALETCLGGASVAGGKMKTTGTSNWLTPNTGATNSSGFAGLPGGSRDYVGSFSNSVVTGHWWSSTENGTSIAWNLNLFWNSGSSNRNFDDKRDGFSVRCLRD